MYIKPLHHMFDLGYKQDDFPNACYLADHLADAACASGRAGQAYKNNDRYDTRIAMIPLRNFKRFFYKTLKQPLYALQVLCKRLMASFSYWFGFGRSSMPEAVTLFLTHRCNLRCKMCGQWGEGGVTKSEGASVLQQELTQDQMHAVIDDLARFKSNITLFGGEPLLFPGCVDLIGYIKRKGLALFDDNQRISFADIRRRHRRRRPR